MGKVSLLQVASTSPGLTILAGGLTVTAGSLTVAAGDLIVSGRTDVGPGPTGAFSIASTQTSPSHVLRIKATSSSFAGNVISGRLGAGATTANAMLLKGGGTTMVQVQGSGYTLLNSLQVNTGGLTVFGGPLIVTGSTFVNGDVALVPGAYSIISSTNTQDGAYIDYNSATALTGNVILGRIRAGVTAGNMLVAASTGPTVLFQVSFP